MQMEPLAASQAQPAAFGLVGAAASASIFQSAFIQVLSTIRPFGTWMDLGISFNTRSHNGKRRQLGQSQRFQRQPRAEARLNNEINLYTRSLPSRLGEVVILFNA